MAMNRCTCGRLVGDWEKNHRCPPAWEVCPKEAYDEYGRAEGFGWKIYADDAKAAAVQYGLEWDAGNYDLVDGGNIDVAVVGRDGQVSYFNLTGSMEPVYEARELVGETS